jgi:histidinol-phosphate phosphatase family protein
MKRLRRTAAFIDKDGTLVHDEPFNVDPRRIRWTPHAIEGLRLLASQGHLLVIVTNQPGVALGRFEADALQGLQKGLQRMLAEEGLRLSGFYACPHAAAPDGTPACACRKPQAGLLRDAARRLAVDLTASWMIGDILDDVEAGHRAGCRSVLLDVGNETVWKMSPMRTPDLRATDLLDAARQITAIAKGPAPVVRLEGHV